MFLRLIDIISRKLTGNTDEDDDWGDDSEWEDVRIDQIIPGDEILTLNEETGKFVESRVNKLMNMGVKQTYLLVTDTGKQIRTTANHPYLTRKKIDTKLIGGTYQVDQSPRIENLTKDSYIAIAKAIHLSVDGVRYHLRHIYEKLHVRSRAEAVAKGLKDHLIPPIH